MPSSVFNAPSFPSTQLQVGHGRTPLPNRPVLRQELSRPAEDDRQQHVGGCVWSGVDGAGAIEDVRRPALWIDRLPRQITVRRSVKVRMRIHKPVPLGFVAVLVANALVTV